MMPIWVKFKNRCLLVSDVQLGVLESVDGSTLNNPRSHMIMNKIRFVAAGKEKSSVVVPYRDPGCAELAFNLIIGEHIAKGSRFIDLANLTLMREPTPPPQQVLAPLTGGA